MARVLVGRYTGDRVSEAAVRILSAGINWFNNVQRAAPRAVGQATRLWSVSRKIEGPFVKDVRTRGGRELIVKSSRSGGDARAKRRYPTCCPLVRFSHIAKGASKMLRATGHARMVRSDDGKL